MILDGYAAYVLAKQQAQKTKIAYDVWSNNEGFIINAINENTPINFECMHIIMVMPHTKLMTREEYMNWL